MVPLVQLVRASDCGSECHGFESHRAPQEEVGRLPLFCYGFIRSTFTKPLISWISSIDTRAFVRILSVASFAFAAALNALMASPNRLSLRRASPSSMRSAHDQSHDQRH